jgi:16S rRNA (adenine1518-N6/adenine1519-N6)-dimethyltransferase
MRPSETKKSLDFRVQEIQQNSPAQNNCKKQFSVPRNYSISGIEDLCNKKGIFIDFENKDQHFMINEKIIKEIVKTAEINEKDTVLEIGAGLGFLTEELAKKAGKVIAIEIDEQFKPVLDELCRKYPNIEVIYGNALKIELPEFNKLVSNIAYNLAEPLLMRILYANFELGVMTLSQHLAEKLANVRMTSHSEHPKNLKGFSGPEKQKQRIRLSMISQSYFDSEIVKIIPAKDFYPAPKIDSAILKFSPIKKEGLEGKKLLVRYFFDQRFSKVKNALRNCLNKYSGKTKREGRQTIQDFNFPEAMLGKLVDNISSQEFEDVLRFFEKIL